MSNKISLNPAAPVVDENAPIEFTYDGEKYVVPVTKRWPLECVDAQEDGQLLKFVKNLLGEAQYKVFRGKPRVLDDVDDLLGEMYKVINADPKESDGSTES